MKKAKPAGFHEAYLAALLLKLYNLPINSLSKGWYSMVAGLWIVPLNINYISLNVNFIIK